MRSIISRVGEGVDEGIRRRGDKGDGAGERLSWKGSGKGVVGGKVAWQFFPLTIASITLANTKSNSSIAYVYPP
jgi:hypothetical protein